MSWAGNKPMNASVYRLPMAEMQYYYPGRYTRGWLVKTTVLPRRGARAAVKTAGATPASLLPQAH